MTVTPVSSPTVPARPQPLSRGVARPPSIRIPPPQVQVAGGGGGASPLTPWSPFTPLSPITPVTPVSPRPSAQVQSNPHLASSHMHSTPLMGRGGGLGHLQVHPHGLVAAPLAQASPLLPRHPFSSSSQSYFPPHQLYPSSVYPPPTPESHHPMYASTSTPFRNPFNTAPTPLLHTHYSAFPSPMASYPYPALSPSTPSVNPFGHPPLTPPISLPSAPHKPLHHLPQPSFTPSSSSPSSTLTTTTTKPSPSELIVNPHLAVSTSAPPTTSSFTSLSSASSSATSRKRKRSAVASSTSEDDTASDDDDDDAASSDAVERAALTGEALHTCPFSTCNKAFLKPSALKRHVRTHTGERPFVCSHSGCGLSFAERGNLKRHERVHSGLKPFRCDLCMHDFARRCHLVQHLKAKHPIAFQQLNE